MHTLLPVPWAGQERVPDGAGSSLHPLLHPPATAPARPLISTASAESLFLLFPQLPLSLGSPPSSPFPCPLSLWSPTAPSPGKLSSCRTSSEPRSRHSKERLGAASLLRLPASICQLLPYISAGSAMRAPSRPSVLSTPPAQDGHLPQRCPQSFGNNTEAEGSPGQGKALHGLAKGRVSPRDAALLTPGNPFPTQRP